MKIRPSVIHNDLDWIYPDGHIWALDTNLFCPKLNDWLDQQFIGFDDSITCIFCDTILYAAEA